MRRSHHRRFRDFHVFFLLIVPSVLLLFLLWLLFAGVFYPPTPRPYNLYELPWLRLADKNNGTFASLCRNHTASSYFLVALLFNRVYGRDGFGIGPYECTQWIEYMLFAGVEHIYWYDCAHSNAETQEAYLSPYLHAGVLTYLRFHVLIPHSLTEGFHFEQDNSYRHFLSHFSGEARWVVQVDVDEYPFSPSDRSSCFLSSLISDYEMNSPNVTQILMQCMIFAGNPGGDIQNGWLIEKYQRRKYETEGVAKGHQSRQKPIYRADLCKGILKHDPHGVWMKEGITVVANEDRIRLNHYWGARETGFRKDTIESTAMLVSDVSIQRIASKIKKATGLVSRKSDAIGAFLRWIAQG